MSKLKRVVKREFLTLSPIPGYGFYSDTLECGHRVVMKKSAGKPKRRRCKDCS